jgi:hypothetical protein
VSEEREDHGEGAGEVDEMQSRQIQPHDIPMIGRPGRRPVPGHGQARRLTRPVGTVGRTRPNR